MISFQVEDLNNQIDNIEFPEEVSLSLMEVLRAWNYPIPAICGGKGLCATCHVIVKNGLHQLQEPTERELDLLDILPDATYRSRLACQIRISNLIEGCLFHLQANKKSYSPC
ncbi:2Fe-2S iron-sulfur cluster-binding protein [Daejeonella oryzae]|uniref:2Fe-2S iron-sulfur cluster-binding protein n=1 Tax=Daejeonella oryzae TaxID=1122943 RepID=UPI0003F5D89B|nr:2Fe-2S iron-sulfur cluster-binding protein [Daejeonella oryzae]